MNDNPLYLDERSQQIYSEICGIRDSLTGRDSDVDYMSLLKNRRVAVVGPARTLIGKKQGRFIDSHDLVVRFNDVFQHLPVPSSLSVDIGTKADILYCNQEILRKSILQQQGIRHTQLAGICHEVELKYVVCTNNGLTAARDDKDLAPDFRKFLDQQRIQAGFRIVYTASEMLMRWMKGHFGRTGFVAILDLLHFDIERLYITGMTFYHGGGHVLSPDSHELHPLKNRDGTWARDHTGFGHDSFVELELMKSIVKCFEKTVEVDDVLTALLQSKNG